MRMAYISVNEQTIARNSRTGSKDAAIAVRFGKSGKAHYTNSVTIAGPSRLVYDPAKPILKCGARLVLIAAADAVTANPALGETA